MFTIQRRDIKSLELSTPWPAVCYAVGDGTRGWSAMGVCFGEGLQRSFEFGEGGLVGGGYGCGEGLGKGIGCEGGVDGHCG